MMRSRTQVAALCLLALGLPGVIGAADPERKPGESNAASSTPDIAKLKAQLDEQQKVIEQLRATLEAQQRMLEQALTARGLVASATPMLPPAATPAAPVKGPAPLLVPPQTAAPATAPPTPLQLQLGNVTIMPVGFMDLTASWKDKNAGGSLGSNFGSIPYNNAAASKLSEFRFSPQNSRLGFRVDGDWKGTHFIGYNEFDFLGTSGSNAISVTNGAFVPRIRLYWVDLRKDKFEFLAGQSWSMLTPNRKGISALPGDLFYSQVVDVNYVIGLPWTRQPGVRFLYHPNDRVTMGVSFENPDAYIGGSGGGPTVTLPTALASLAGSQLDNATNVQTTPNLHPDIIGKIAFDPSARLHVEVAGIERTFRVWNPTTGVYSTKAAGGGSINANVEVVKNLRLVTNNLWGDGVGRYFFGNSPDLILRADGSISPIHSGGFVEGFEATVKNTLWYAYYGAVYIRRNTALDSNGTSLVGYGYRGAPNSQNKTVQEITLGFNQSLWRDPRYGALNIMGQYQYLLRNPWFIAPNTPKDTHDNTIFVNIRYTLPGSAPPPKSK